MQIAHTLQYYILHIQQHKENVYGIYEAMKKKQTAKNGIYWSTFAKMNFKLNISYWRETLKERAVSRWPHQWSIVDEFYKMVEFHQMLD